MSLAQKSMEKHATHGFSQFRLTNNLLQNLYKYDISPTGKLVLLYLSSCYNPKKAHMFPKQKTIAAKIGVSERSVVRAIQELVKEGLIVIECKYTNYYKFTSQIVSKPPMDEKKFGPENMSDDLRQNDIQKDDNLSQHDSKPINEPINEPVKVDDFKILKQYAQEHKAKNITAYINFLKKNGSAEKIIADFKAKEASDKYFAKQIKQTQEFIKQSARDAQTASAPTKEWEILKAQAREIINGKLYTN